MAISCCVIITGLVMLVVAVAVCLLPPAALVRKKENEDFYLSSVSLHHQKAFSLLSQRLKRITTISPHLGHKPL